MTSFFSKQHAASLWKTNNRSSIYSKKIKGFPEAYINYLERSKAPAERVCDSPPEDAKYLDYSQDKETGYVYRKPDYPTHVTWPPQSQYGLWGNVGCVVGFEKPKRLKPRICRIWTPDLEKHTLYSDILDIYINMIVSTRTLKLIDDSKGFDFYILSTRVQDLKSELGRKLQHKMLQVLASGDVSDYIKEKYKDYIKPKEEVEWEALEEHEVVTKIKIAKAEQSIDPPLRSTYGKMLIEDLKASSVAK